MHSELPLFAHNGLRSLNAYSKTSIKTITNLSDTNCLEIHRASLPVYGVLKTGTVFNDEDLKPVLST